MLQRLLDHITKMEILDFEKKRGSPARRAAFGKGLLPLGVAPRQRRGATPKAAKVLRRSRGNCGRGSHCVCSMRKVSGRRGKLSDRFDWLSFAPECVKQMGECGSSQDRDHQIDQGNGQRHRHQRAGGPDGAAVPTSQFLGLNGPQAAAGG